MTAIEQKAADYLLSILAVEPVIQYSRFYGTDEARAELLKGLGITEEEDDTECTAESAMDGAVWHLSKQGIVQKTDLDEKLIDGEPDYQIRLLKK